MDPNVSNNEKNFIYILYMREKKTLRHHSNVIWEGKNDWIESMIGEKKLGENDSGKKQSFDYITS